MQFLCDDKTLFFGARLFMLIFILNGHKYLWFCGFSSPFFSSLFRFTLSQTHDSQLLACRSLPKCLPGASVSFHRVTPQEPVFLSPILNHIWRHLYITSFKTWKGSSDCVWASCRRKFDLFISIFNLNIYAAKINPDYFYSVFWEFGILGLHFPLFSFLLTTWGN